MRINKNKCAVTMQWRRSALTVAFLTVLLFSSRPGHAQTSSLSTFSPYTMYGLGDMAIGGNAFSRGMGAVGVAHRSPFQFNYLNPAALSAMSRNSALFNFAGEGRTLRSKSDLAKTTYNTFNLHDLGLAVPLGRGVGLGFSLTPVSSLGYETQVIDNDPKIVEDVGRTVYGYSGEGGISQVALNLGVRVIPNFSLGVSASYWFGSINRQFSSSTYSYLYPSNFRTIISNEDENISEMLFTFGAQYIIRVGENALTVGATYQPEIKSKIRYKQLVVSASQYASDTIHSEKTKRDFTIPSKFAAGVYYQSAKFAAGFDYSRQDWKGSFEIPADQMISLRAQEDYKIGFSYSPNPFDIRKAMNRWTYKVGGRYGTSYLVSKGQKLHDMAVSFGVDFALKKQSMSKLGFGIELGQRGSSKQGQIREKYINFVLALNFFGEDFWFQRPKYN